MTVWTDKLRPLRASIAKNRTLLIILGILAAVFLLAISSMSPRDWVITLLRGLSVGAVTFLVAAGFSLIFGLMDVLNLAQGTLFMIGAYIGWTVYVRPDTFVDLLTPMALLLAGLLTRPLWENLLGRLRLPAGLARIWPWVGLILALAVIALTTPRSPVAAWDPAVYDRSPVVYGMMLDQGILQPPPHAQFQGISPLVVWGGTLVGAALLAASLAGLGLRKHHGGAMAATRIPWRSLVGRCHPPGRRHRPACCQ